MKGNAAEKTSAGDIGLTITMSGWGASDSSREGEGFLCIKQKKKEDDEEEEDFVWLVGFLATSSTTRLYRRRAPRQSG